MLPPRLLYPGMWMKGTEEGWYLTFDDGPTPGVTDEVIALLERYQIKASFFLLGTQLAKHPEYLPILLSKGHAIGFHGHQHQDGFMKSTAWMQQNFIRPSVLPDVSLFRAPYGRMWPWQYRQLKKLGQWVHWTCMVGDFYPTGHRLTDPQLLTRRLSKLSSHELFVFHDSKKAKDQVIWMLKAVIETGLQRGVTFRILG
jgi:peptidoglycan/xylan/chitin deacetylase (PgdA/CDA1 family)